MTNRPFRLRLAAWAVVPLAIYPFAGLSPGQAVEERAGRLDEMRSLVRAIKISDGSRPSRAPEPLAAEPLHRWNDPTREFSDGSLWAFGAKGRPIALATMELYGGPKGTSTWSYELISLAPGPIVGEAEGRYATLDQPFNPQAGGPLRWEPEGRGVEMRGVANTPAPARAEADRLRQMKAISGRISAREAGANRNDGRETELRLMPRPIHRYADPDSGLVDGAIFLYAYGTNPELLVLIEARQSGDAVEWSCGFARLSRAALTVKLDGKEAWSRPYAESPPPRDPYFIVRTGRRPKD